MAPQPKRPQQHINYPSAPSWLVQRAPHPSRVKEIRCKCTYNGAICSGQITQCQLCCPPVGSVSQGMNVCVYVWVCPSVCACVQSGDFPDSFAQWKASCLPVYLFGLLIADHTSYVTSPRILQDNLLLVRRAAAAGGGGAVSRQVVRRWNEHNHTQRWGDSHGWHYCSCVAPNGRLTWLIKGKPFRRGGTDGAALGTEAGTGASELNAWGLI